MTYDEETDELILSTGRRVYCFACKLSISSDNRAYCGSDSFLGDGDPGSFTDAEREEIALEAISRWQLWASGI